MDTDTGAAAQSSTAPQNQQAALDKRTADQAKGPIMQREGVLSARDQLMKDMDEKVDALRKAESEKFARDMGIDPNSVDPRAAAIARAMEIESLTPEQLAARRAAARSAGDGREAVPLTVADAAATAALNGAPDPLADFIVVQDGKPMLRMVVDGKEQTVPLDQARATLQKAQAVETRFRQAATRTKELDAREAALRAREAARTAQAAPARVAPSPAPTLDLKSEARSLVHSLLTEPEDKAAARMEGVLQKIAAQAPKIDSQAIVQEAAGVAVQAVAAQRHQEALVDGLSEFETKYRQVAEDSDLRTLADSKTTSIAREHPTWTPAQVMLEAGRQVHERFVKTPVQDAAANGAGAQPRVSVPANQQRKDNLVPMPQARSGILPASAATDEPMTEQQSAAEALAEIRKGRGQPN